LINRDPPGTVRDLSTPGPKCKPWSTPTHKLRSGNRWQGRCRLRPLCRSVTRPPSTANRRALFRRAFGGISPGVGWSSPAR